MKIKFVLILCFFFCACNAYIRETPKKYVYNAVPKSKSEYTQDSITLVYLLQTMLVKHIHPFTLTQSNDALTSIYLDSILYSPNKDGMVILIITRSSKTSLDSNNYLYNAYYLFGKEDSLNRFKLYDYSSIQFINFNSYSAARNALIEYCFGRRATEHPFSKQEPRYNMNDIRFWQGHQFEDIYTDTNSINF